MDDAEESPEPHRREVAETYDRIAAHFSETREYPWPEVEAFLSEQSHTSLALDLGCGNGRHAELLAESADRVVAADASRGLLAEARERAANQGFDANIVQADAARLPLRDATAGLAVYVATIHHLPSRSARVESLDELARVLTPEGRALVSAWSTAHDRFDREGSEPQGASDSRVDEVSGSGATGGSGERRSAGGRETGFDTTVDWTLPGGERVGRFYHIYSPEEFEADVAESSLELVDSEISSGNCYATVRRAKQ